MDYNEHKGLLIGIGAALAVGLGVFALFAGSEEAREKAEAVVNRQRAKHVVRQTFGGSKPLMKAIDTLGDKEINNVLSVMDKASRFGGDVSDSMSDVASFFTKRFGK